MAPADGYLQPVSTHVPLQHVGTGEAGQKQTLGPCFVASRSASYWDFEIALIEALGQKQFEVHASPSQTLTQSLSALHDVT